MEPTPETAEALAEITRYTDDDDDLLEQFRATAAQTRALVPECWGMSLSFLREQLTFTLIASDARTAQLDGLQYAVGGPCVDAVHDGRQIVTGDLTGPLDEETWR